MILRGGGFAQIKAEDAQGLAYWKMSGGREAGREITMKDVPALIDQAAEGLARRAVLFAHEHTPYAPRVKPMYESDTGDYDHLARVRAWSTMGDDGDGA